MDGINKCMEMESIHILNPTIEIEIVIGNVRFKSWMNDGCDYDE